MTSRERILAALHHQEPDRVPIDLGGTSVSGMHVSSVYALRQALRLDPPRTPVKVIKPYQMLGEIAPDLADALSVDTAGVVGSGTPWGYALEDWKEWTLFDGTPVLVPGKFNTDPAPNGDIYQYPRGNKSLAPSACMPKDGFYFDAIMRQEPIDEEALDVEDNLEECGPMSEHALDELAAEVDTLYQEDGRALVASLGGTSFGDVAHIPGMMLERPKGIRDVAEWYMSLTARPHYLRELFERQCDIALANWERIYTRIGNKLSVVFVTGTDFGAQLGPLVSPETYRQLFKPVHRRVNDWIHAHTQWASFIHSCGAVTDFLDDFIDAGFQILNPVQCSAAGMAPEALKERWGKRIVFWGGGVDTQKTLPFGTPEEVRAEVRERIRVFGRGGGFVFGAIHNVQARVPVRNLLALFDEASKTY